MKGQRCAGKGLYNRSEEVRLSGVANVRQHQTAHGGEVRSTPLPACTPQSKAIANRFPENVCYEKKSFCLKLAMGFLDVCVRVFKKKNIYHLTSTQLYAHFKIWLFRDSIKNK